MNSGVTYDELIAYAAGDLAGPAANHVRRHLESDPDAASTVARYRLAAERLAADDSVVPPLHAIAGAKAIFRPRTQPRTGTWLERLDALVAHLVFDSRLQPALVRSAATAGRVQLAFEVDEYEVDLVAERDDDAPWRITGQVGGSRPVDGLDLAVTHPGSTAAVANATTDAHGAFTFEVTPGTYDLCVRSTPTIVMQDIELE